MQKMNLPEEKEYYIAYFDILGYKDFFSHASKETIQNTILMIYDGISNIKSYLSRYSGFSFGSILNNIEVEFIGFSDNFTFAMQVGKEQYEIYRLLAFLSIIADIQRNFLLMYGLLVRGGIVKSTAYIGENIIQGQGIIDAVSKEHDAVYPQITIDSSIYTYVHTLHFLTYTELEYGASVQNKIDAGLELNSDEQKFLKDISDKYQKEKLALTWKDIILMRSNDEKPFLNYMYNIKVMKFYVEHYIPFNIIRDLLQQLNLESSFEIPKEEDAVNYIQKHREILIDKIKQYGDYADINIDNIGAVLVIQSRSACMRIKSISGMMGRLPEGLDSTDKLFMKHFSKPYNLKLANVFFMSGKLKLE